MAWLQHFPDLDSRNLSCRGSGLAPAGWGRHQEPCCSGCLAPVVANKESVGLGLNLPVIVCFTKKWHNPNVNNYINK